MLQQDSHYVERSVDGDCLRALRAGRNFYVFGPPRVGKTFLRRRIAATLRSNGLRVAEVDLNAMGQGAFTGSTLYFDLAAAIATPFGLPPALTFWEHYAHLPPEERWQRYLRSAPAGAPVVLLVDGAEVLSGDRHDREAFFAALGPTAQVGQTPVVVGLFGTIDRIGMGIDIATPGADRSAVRAWFRTAVELKPGDFTTLEAEALLDRLDSPGGDSRALLDAILDWTGGHPALTTALVDAIGDGGPLMISGSEVDTVAATVEALFIEPPISAEPTLAAAEAWADFDTPTATAQWWRRILDGQRPGWRPGDQAQRRLMMGGFVRVEGAELRPRNLLMAAVFDEDWCDARVIAEGLPARTAAWLTSDRDPAHLLTGSLLRRASRWAEGRDVDEGIRELLLASWVHARHSERPAAVAPPPVDDDAPTTAVATVAVADAPVAEAGAAARVAQPTPPATRDAAGMPGTLKWLAVAVAVMTVVAGSLLFALWRTQGTLDATAAALLGRTIAPAPAPAAVSPDRVAALEAALAQADERLRELEGDAPAAAPADGELTFDLAEVGEPVAAVAAAPEPVTKAAPKAAAPRVTARRIGTARANPGAPAAESAEARARPEKAARKAKGKKARKRPRKKVRERRANTPSRLAARSKLDSATAPPGPIAPPSPQTSIARQAPTYRRSLVRCKLYDLPQSVRLSLTVKPDGRVAEARMLGGQAGRIDQSCVEQSARRFRFAPFAGSAVTAAVDYRL